MFLHDRALGPMLRDGGLHPGEFPSLLRYRPSKDESHGIERLDRCAHPLGNCP